MGEINKHDTRPVAVWRTCDDNIPGFEIDKLDVFFIDLALKVHDRLQNALPN